MVLVFGSTIGPLVNSQTHEKIPTPCYLTPILTIHYSTWTWSFGHKLSSSSGSVVFTCIWSQNDVISMHNKRIIWNERWIIFLSFCAGYCYPDEDVPPDDPLVSSPLIQVYKHPICKSEWLGQALQWTKLPVFIYGKHVLMLDQMYIPTGWSEDHVYIWQLFTGCKYTGHFFFWMYCIEMTYPAKVFAWALHKMFGWVLFTCCTGSNQREQLKLAK